MKEIVIYLIIATLPNGNKGLISLNGEIIIPFEYSQLYDLNDKYFKAQNSNGLWGVVDINNNVVFPFEFEDLGYQMNFNLLPAKKNSKWGVINRIGETVLPFEYDRISDFDSEGKAFTTKNGYYGVIDNSFNELIPNNYKKLSPFRNDISIFIDSNGNHGCIDSKNRILFKFPKDYKLKHAYEYPSKKIITMEIDNELLSGVIDLQGNILIEPKYNSDVFIKKKNGTEYIHGVNNLFKNGNYEFELYINETKHSYNGIIRSLDYNYGIKGDRTVISVESNGQIKFGVIDPEGIIVVPIEYEDLKYLREFENDTVNDSNIILAQKGKVYGIINENENIYFDFRYPKMTYLNHGFYRNDVQEGTLLYNKEGHLIIEDTEIWYWFQIEENPNLFYARDSQNMYGIINENGKWIIQPMYKNLGFVRKFKKL